MIHKSKEKIFSPKFVNIWEDDQEAKVNEEGWAGLGCWMACLI